MVSNHNVVKGGIIVNFARFINSSEMMDIRLLKFEIFNHCQQTLWQRAEEARKAMQEAQQAANDYGAPCDRYDSFRTQVLGRRDMYAKQFDEALRQSEMLKKIDPGLCLKRVEYGALVLTNSQLLFVSVGLGKLMAGETVFFAISPRVPLFEAINGRKQGDVCRFRGEDFTILNVC